MTKHLPITQRGFTLIELLISLALGLLIVAAATFMFLSSKQAFRTQEGMSDVQEASRTGLRVLTTIVRYAGYLQDPVRERDPTAVFKGPTQLPIQGTEGAPPVSLGITDYRADTSVLMVSYRGNDDNAVVGCLGSAITGAQLVTNVFYLSAANAAQLSSLMCAQRVDTGAVTRQPLIDGVRDFEVRYLVDTNSDGVPDRLMAADQIEASATPTPTALWRSTRSAQITLTVASLGAVNPQGSAPAAYGDASGRILRTFNTTVALRNPFVP